MCLVINIACPCGHDGDRGATLPCPKAFAKDSRAKNRVHSTKILNNHYDTCAACRQWCASGDDQGPPWLECDDRDCEVERGMYQVFCKDTITQKGCRYCCEDCYGPDCVIHPGAGPILQETSARSEKRAISGKQGTAGAGRRLGRAVSW